jgi:hypothetical protein
VHELALVPLLPEIVQQPSELSVGQELTIVPPLFLQLVVNWLVSPPPETPVHS